jgi:hypothetical protein
MRFTNIPLNRILAVLATLFSIAVFNLACAIDAPDAVVALWFPALGEDLSNSPKDSIEHAIWLIQRGEFRQAEEILDRVKGGNTVNVSGLFARKYLDSVRDTTVDIVPEHVADSLLRPHPNFEIVEEISAVPEDLQSPVYFAGFFLDSNLFACLNSVPYMASVKMISEVRGSLTDEVTQVLAERINNCSGHFRDNSEFVIPHLQPNFAPYFKSMVDAALVPAEHMAERARAYLELANTALVHNDVCASGFFHMQFGDVLAAPGASPLMMGIRRDFAQALETAPTKGKQIAQKLMLTNFDKAISAYASAQSMLDQCRGGIYAHWISVRRAYIAYRKGDPDAGALYQTAALHAKAHGDLRVARIAQATGGLLSGSQEPVRQAVKESVDARDFGAAMTIWHISEIIADRLVREKDEPDRAIVLTISSADLFRDARLPGAAAELYHMAANIFSKGGRVETQLYFLTEALKSASEFEACRSAVIEQGYCQSSKPGFDISGPGYTKAELVSTRNAALSLMFMREPLQGQWATFKSKSDSDVLMDINNSGVEGNDQIVAGHKRIVKKIRPMISGQFENNKILLSATAIAHPAFLNATNCQEKLVAQDRVQNLTHDKALQQDLLAFRAIARCDPRVVTELKKALYEIDPIAPLLNVMSSDVGDSLLEQKIRQQIAIHSMDLAFHAAFQLEEYELLAKWINKISVNPALFADYEAMDFQFQWYSALIASKQGDYSKSRVILHSLLTHPDILEKQTERLKIRSAIVNTEIQASDSQKSFEAYLEWRQDVTSQRQRQTGVRRATPESAELARLERRVALGDTISAQDDAQIRALLQRIPIRDTTVAPAVALDSIENAMPSDSTLVVYFMSRRLAAAWVREPGKRRRFLDRRYQRLLSFCPGFRFELAG